jgi:hypothetical protein
MRRAPELRRYTPKRQSQVDKKGGKGRAQAEKEGDARG